MSRRRVDVLKSTSSDANFVAVDSQSMLPMQHSLEDCRYIRIRIMLVVGLTGGIASGKSFVADCLVGLGCERINADEIGHQVLEQVDVIEAIVAYWGSDVLQANGQIDRKELGQRVFNSRHVITSDVPSDDEFDNQTESDTAELKVLESITHPRIGQTIREQLDRFKNESNKPAIILDAPVMFKAGWDRVCDRIIFVHANLEVRQNRARKRGWPDGELQRRESFQLRLDQKRQRATDVIDNSDDSEKTRFQINQLWQDWKLKQLL